MRLARRRSTAGLLNIRHARYVIPRSTARMSIAHAVQIRVRHDRRRFTEKQGEQHSSPRDWSGPRCCCDISTQVPDDFGRRPCRDF